MFFAKRTKRFMVSMFCVSSMICMGNVSAGVSVEPVSMEVNSIENNQSIYKIPENKDTNISSLYSDLKEKMEGQRQYY